MTATLTIMLIGLGCLAILFLCMPAAVLIAKWIDAEFPGLWDNLKFWALVVGGTLLALVTIVGVPG